MTKLSIQEWLAVANTAIAFANLVVAIYNYRHKVKLNKKDALED